MEITDIKIYMETDYSRFKTLKGNRTVEDERVNSIIASIQKIGYQRVPILVNEKYEIIDGQGRVAACKHLGLPVYFEIQEGIGLDECIAMNIKMKNWDIYDFINSYSAKGNENYIKLLAFKELYPELTEVEIAMCLSDAKSKNIDRPLRNGNYKMIDSDDNVECLRFISSVVKELKMIKGGSQQYVPVLVGLFKLDLMDDERMVKAINENRNSMNPAYNITDALSELQNVYNFKSRHKEYFRDSYLKAMQDLGARYKD